MTVRLMLLGAPGVGKGTYAKLLAKELNLSVLTVGDLVRSEIKTQSEVGRSMALFSQQGRLVPDELIVSLVQQELQKRLGGIILDGFPRTIPQAEALRRHFPLDCVINLRMKESYLVQKALGRRICKRAGCGKSFNVAYVYDEAGAVDMPPIMPSHGHRDRCECGQPLMMREDDREEVIRNRLRIYREETFPLVEYYESQGVLKTIEIKKGLKDFPKILALARPINRTKL